jgi:Domain of unknown function (DUF4416)
VVVKPLVGILTARAELLPALLDAFAERFGPADIVGDWIPFSHTTYYEAEMGPGLLRLFASFEALQAPDAALAFKSFANGIEDRYRIDGRRTVNLDAGYLDANKLVLVSGKHGGHKICVAPGLFLDLLLWYNKGWIALPWAFPDFRDGRLFPLFCKMRTAFKAQLKSLNGV